MLFGFCKSESAGGNCNTAVTTILTESGASLKQIQNYAPDDYALGLEQMTPWTQKEIREAFQNRIKSFNDVKTKANDTQNWLNSGFGLY